MSVTSTTNRKSYSGDAVTTSFATNPVVFFDSSDLVVSVISAAGVETVLTENTHYVVTGGDGSTGTVNLAGGSAPYGAPAVGVTLLILRVVALTQPVDFVQNDGSDAEVQETAYDRLTMMVQQLDEVDDRSLKVSPAEAGTAALTELPFDRAGKFLAFDASKNLIAAAGTTEVPVSAFMETVLDDSTASDARTTLGAAASGVNSDITGFSMMERLGDLLVATTDNAMARAGLPEGFFNGQIAAAVSGNALLIAIKGSDGNDPSVTNPVYVGFRNATANPTVPIAAPAAFTAAQTLTISSGSTLGTLSGFANRIWIVAFNDGGTLRLGAINCLVVPGGGVNQIFPLRNGIYSSTAEGGAGAADSAGVIYTATAVTSKAMTILGYIESSQTTAGTWVTTPSKVQVFRPGIPLPGTVVQDINKNYTAVATGTTAIPRDDTQPLIGEGDEYMSQAFTLLDSCNLARVFAIGNFSDSNAGGHITMALFADSTLVGAVTQYTGTTAGSLSRQLTIQRNNLAGTSSSVTYSIRAGNNTGATTTFNGASGARLFGGAMSSTITVQEIMV